MPAWMYENGKDSMRSDVSNAMSKVGGGAKKPKPKKFKKGTKTAVGGQASGIGSGAGGGGA